MKPLAHSVGAGKPVKTGFNVDNFVSAMALKGIKIRVNDPPPNKARRWGELDHINGRPVRFPDNDSYLEGFKSYEPLIVTRRIEGKQPQYTLADVDYQTELTGLPEWFNTPHETLYYACAVDNPKRLGFGWRITEYHEKNKTFKQRVFEDSQIKPDVARLYQSAITGDLSTSIDHGKTWFDGGVMDYPLMPKVEIRELHGGGYRAIGKGWDCDYHYVTRAFPRLDELKKGSFKLKPPRPTPPKFDDLYWINDEWSWWQYHQKQHEECRLDWLYGDEYRCPCYHAKVAEYERAVKKYELAIEKWLNL